MESKTPSGKNKFILSALALAVSATTANADVIFSEYVEGSSYNKAFELFNSGDQAVDLSEYTVNLYSNGSPTASKSLPLEGSLDAGKVYVIAHTSASDAIQKRSQLLNGSITNFNGDDDLELVHNGIAVDFIGYKGEQREFGKDITLARKVDIHTGTTLYTESEWNTFAKDDIDGLGYEPGTRVPDSDNGGDEGGEIDPGPSFGSCENPGNVSRISEIQQLSFETDSDGDIIPQYVLAQGIVTQVTASGYFIQQNKTADDPEGTSTGIYVYDNINRPEKGDKIYFRAKATEYENMTQLTGVSPDEQQVCSSGQAIPDPVQLTMPLTDLDQYEGMQVKVSPLPGDDGFYVTDSYSLSRYGQIGVSSGAPLLIPTDNEIPGSEEALAIKESNAQNRLILEDGFSGQNPVDIAYYPDFSHDNAIRIGSRVENELSGGLYRFRDDFQLVPTEQLQLADDKHPRIEQPEDVDNDAIRVASFNVLNYFNGYAGEDGTLTPDDDKFWEMSNKGEARGATNKDEFAVQREKIITAINSMNADVIGILEMENDGWGEDSAIHDLVVDGLNTVSGKTYDYIRTNSQFIGTDVIKVSLIYNTDALETVGEPTILSAYPFDEETRKHRPPMIQTFKEKSSGEEITVAINHFKSKGSSCSSLGDGEDPFGQGNCNRMRVSAAETLGRYLDEHYKDKDVLLVGDLNAYGKEDPVLMITNGDNGTRDIEKVARDEEGNHSLTVTDYRMNFINLGPKYIQNPYFSYSYGGELGSLDHALASPTLDGKVVKVQDWNINASEPTGMDYTTAYKPEEVQEKLIVANSPFRSSDHNPIMVDIKLSGGDSTDDGDNSGTNTGDDDDSGSMGWFTLGLGLLGLAGRRRKRKVA